MSYKDEIKENIRRLEREIKECAAESGVKEPMLLAVSKTRPKKALEAAYEAGLRHFAENRVQNLRDRFDEMADYPDIDWHLIGTLQRNKVKYVVGKVSLIHSVDSLRLLEEISKQAERFDCSQDVLLQVNISGEDSKHGFEPDEVLKSLKELDTFERVNLRGLMTMAPHYQDASKTLPVFKGLADLAAKIRESGILSEPEDFNILSMGMSNDYLYAIKAGASILRIGSSVFNTSEEE